MPSRKLRFRQRNSDSFLLTQSPSFFPFLLRLTSNGFITFASKHIDKLIGFSQKELIHTFFQEYCNSREYNCFLQKLEETLAMDEDYFEIDLHLVGKNGLNILVHIAVAVLGSYESDEQTELVLIINGTDVKPEAHTKYENVAKHLFDGIITICEQKIVYADRASEDLFEAGSKDDIVGQPLSTFLCDGCIDLSKYEIEEHSMKQLEITWKTARGNTIYSEVYVVPTTYLGKKAFELLIKNITEKRKTEKSLIEAEKLSIAGQLAAGIAHEIRNPITALKGFLQLMKLDLQTKSDYWDIMESELERIETISNELLYLAKPCAAKLKPIELKRLILEVCLLLESQANLHNIIIVKRIPEEDVVIFGNETQIKQVFVNIIKNAIEVMANGGKITINVEKQEESVNVSIIDEGCGIPKDHLEKIGNPFFTTKKDGTGLGLMVTYNIIRNHRGTISVVSEVDVGTTFTITLPLFNFAQNENDRGVG